MCAGGRGARYISVVHGSMRVVSVRLARISIRNVHLSNTGHVLCANRCAKDSKCFNNFELKHVARCRRRS